MNQEILDENFCIPCNTVIKKTKCIHNITKKICKLCNPNAYCEHQKLKVNCIDCKGNNICIHNKNKKICKLCNPIAYCEHDKLKANCIDCKGKNICIHNKNKNFCKLCNPKSFCHHDKLKVNCIDCKGKNICIHNIKKYCCSKCNPKILCIHKNNKYYCKECNKYKYYCEHEKYKDMCKLCGGKGICEHNTQRQQCKICNVELKCKSEWCFKSGYNKYNGYCLTCCIYICPEIKVSRNYKTKENFIADIIIKNYPNKTWIHDKKVQDGCSKKRPDLLLDMGSHIIIVEIDENAHLTYNTSCENKRLMIISQDLGHRPIVFIRFNPDEYINEAGNKILSCWKLNGFGIYELNIKMKTEWNERIDKLLETIEFYVNNIVEKTITIVELYY